VYLQNEQEQSAYNFEHSDAAFLFDAFAAHEKQALYLMTQTLALPASADLGPWWAQLHACSVSSD
jgi:glycyl-tRNA synthetase alpha chain